MTLNGFAVQPLENVIGFYFVSEEGIFVICCGLCNLGCLQKWQLQGIDQHSLKLCHCEPIRSSLGTHITVLKSVFDLGIAQVVSCSRKASYKQFTSRLHLKLPSFIQVERIAKSKIVPVFFQL